MYQRGVAMAQEFRGKGVNVQLGPMMCVWSVCNNRAFTK